MNQSLLTYRLHDDVLAFTTRRTVGRNRERICQLLGITDDELVYPHQTHTDKVEVVDEALLALTAEARKEMLEGVDAVITKVKGICIGVSTADCIPVIMYDPRRKVAAAVHAGWRGTVARIVQKTLQLMEHTYGTEAKDVKAVIGPGIAMESFEIGDEVYEEFVRQDFDMHPIARRFPDSRNADAEKWHIDLPLCNKMQLTALGVSDESVEICAVDTYRNTDRFFSARIEQTGKEKCGRNFNAIMIR